MDGLAGRYRALGIKLTPQRLAIFDCIEGNRSHPSAEEIYSEVRKRFPTMSLATVYNTLEVLMQKGEVQALTIDPARTRYDPDTSSHHHIICLGCSKVVDVHAEMKNEVPEVLRHGFNITGSRTEFYGLCPECNDIREV